MTGATFTVLGLAPPRTRWFGELSAWAMSGVLPIEFVKCISTEELRARLRSGRYHSALVVDAGTSRLDRDVIAAAHESGCAVVIVDDDRQRRDWVALGADASLGRDFDRSDLIAVLEAHARPVDPVDAVIPSGDGPASSAPWEGTLVAVIGRTGSGVSTISAAVAQSYADDARHGQLVLLADLALESDQALLHDAVDVLPGVQELVESHRIGAPTARDVRAGAFAVPHRGYDLLLGLRRSSDWVALRPRSLEAAVRSLCRSYRVVVADCSPELMGERETGSMDLEERNAAARVATSNADVVMAVGTPSLVGVRSLVRQVDALIDHGVDAGRILTVVNRAPRSARARSELTRAVHGLVDGPPREALATPVFVSDRSSIDDVHRSGGRFPAQPGRRLRDAAQALCDRAGALVPDTETYERVAPGSLVTLTVDGE